MKSKNSTPRFPKRVLRAAAVLPAVGLLLATGPTASARPAPAKAPAKTGTKTAAPVTPAAPVTGSTGGIPAGAAVAPMTVAGVDRAVAESHGFKVVTDADGTVRSVPTAAAVNPDGTPYHQGVRPQNVVDGNCGESYLWIHSVGGYNSEIETGFNLELGAVAFHWQVNRSDNWGSDSHSWGGGLGVDEHWQGEWDIHSGGLTWETAGVVPSSDVLLWDGEICHAGAPSDTTWVF